MGVGADGNNKAFHAADITNFMKRNPVSIYRDLLNYEDHSNTNHVLVAVDPSGGGSSAFAICSMAQTPSGAVVVICSNGQLPSFSPANISLRITDRKT